MQKTHIITISGLAIMLLLITACSSNQAPPATAQAEVAEQETTDEITVQLSWIHEYSVSQLHNAEKNGHFAEQGLDVTIVEGGFTDEGMIDQIEEVVSGNAQFGTANGSDILLARQAGKPIIAVLSTLHRSPNAIISLEDAEILRPQDLVGKTIAVADGGSLLSYDHLLNILDIDPDSINRVPRTTFGIDILLNGDVDAIMGWIINEAVMIEEADQTANTIALSEYAVDSYDSLIFTTEDMIENNPEVVQRFVNAVVAGMQDILDDTETSIDNTLQFNEELDHDAQLSRLNVMIPLMNITGQPLGGMQADVWELTHQLLLDGDVLEEAQDWESAYTTQFITSISEDE